MSGARFPRKRLASVLLEERIPDSYRIIPQQYRATPLGTPSGGFPLLLPELQGTQCSTPPPISPLGEALSFADPDSG